MSSLLQYYQILAGVLSKQNNETKTKKAIDKSEAQRKKKPRTIKEKEISNG